MILSALSIQRLNEIVTVRGVFDEDAFLGYITSITSSRPLRQHLPVSGFEREAFNLHFTLTTTRVEPQAMECLRFINNEFHVMPFAVVLHLEVEVFAFGEDGLGVSGPVEFSCAGGFALEAELEGVGAGL